MSKRLDIQDLISRIKWALTQANGWSTVPIDLAAVSNAIGLAVEWRWMVPEGVMVHSANGLKIYLQSNFRDDRRLTRRQRFTWAHEICHALFYDRTIEGPAQLLAGTPHGAVLEKLCQQGAGYLLVPSESLHQDFSGKNAVESVQDLTCLADKYDVSADVMIRRLHEVDGALATDYAILLLRQRDGMQCIESAAYGPWLRTHANPPKVGQIFDHWADPILRAATQVSATTWTKRMGSRDLNIFRSAPSRRAEFIEIRLV